MNPTESIEQRILATWLRIRRVLFCHVPNGGARSAATGRKLKEEGVERGVPDILIFDPPPSRPGIVGVAIELKRRKGGRVSKQQQVWLDGLKSRGWIVAVCNGAEEAIGLLRQLGYG